MATLNLKQDVNLYSDCNPCVPKDLALQNIQTKLYLLHNVQGEGEGF